MVFLTNSMMKFIFFPFLLGGSGAKRWFLTGILLAFIGSIADSIWLKKMGAGKACLWESRLSISYCDA